MPVVYEGYDTDSDEDSDEEALDWLQELYGDVFDEDEMDEEQ